MRPCFHTSVNKAHIALVIAERRRRATGEGVTVLGDMAQLERRVVASRGIA